MAFKVCIAWAISAVAVLVSSAIASPSHKGSSPLTLPSTDVASSTDEGVAADGEEEHADEPEEDAD